MIKTKSKKADLNPAWISAFIGLVMVLFTIGGYYGYMAIAGLEQIQFGTIDWDASWKGLTMHSIVRTEQSASHNYHDFVSQAGPEDLDYRDMRFATAVLNAWGMLNTNVYGKIGTSAQNGGFLCLKELTVSQRTLLEGKGFKYIKASYDGHCEDAEYYFCGGYKPGIYQEADCDAVRKCGVTIINKCYIALTGKMDSSALLNFYPNAVCKLYYTTPEGESKVAVGEPGPNGYNIRCTTESLSGENTFKKVTFDFTPKECFDGSYAFREDECSQEDFVPETPSEEPEPEEETTEEESEVEKVSWFKSIINWISKFFKNAKWF